MAPAASMAAVALAVHDCCHSRAVLATQAFLQVPPSPIAMAAASSGCDGRLPICIGTDCTGLGSVLIALIYLNVAYRPDQENREGDQVARPNLG